MARKYLYNCIKLCTRFDTMTMKKSKISIIAASFLSGSFLLASCGNEPAGEHLPPETTQGDYLGNDDLHDTAGVATDTAMMDTTQLEP